MTNFLTALVLVLLAESSNAGYSSTRPKYCVDDALVRSYSAPVGGEICNSTTTTACNCESTECFYLQSDPDHCGSGCVACAGADDYTVAICESGVCSTECKRSDETTAYCNDGAGCYAVTLSGNEPANVVPACNGAGGGFKCKRGWEFIVDLDDINASACFQNGNDDDNSQD